MATIYDLVTAPELSAYWEALPEEYKGEADGYFAESLFPARKQLGMRFSDVGAQRGLPVLLKNSAFDVHAVPRPRIGAFRVEQSMAFFKESKYVDEELRQQLNMVIDGGNPQYVNTIVAQIFDDVADLLKGARATREYLRMMALTTGVVSLSNNGQVYTLDYQLPEDHKGNVGISWNTTATSDPVKDIRIAMDKVYTDTGVRPTRAVCDYETWLEIYNSASMKNSLYPLTNGAGPLNDELVKNYLRQQLFGLEITVNEAKYILPETTEALNYMPANTFVLYPTGNLGETVFGTTPEESDLMGQSVANVSVVDTGVAITTMTKADPVNVETKVSMITMPRFTQRDKVYIMSTRSA